MNVLWYVTRGSGVTSLLLLTGSVLLGVITSMDLTAPGLPRFVSGALHRNISLLALAFVGLHITATVVDGYVAIGWVDAVVPFLSSYHPLALGLGTIAFDLLLALIATSLLRSRIAPATWRFVHLSAYACWPIALLHGVLIGTDRVEGWMLLVDGACVFLVLVASLVRAVRRRARVGGRLDAVR
jgi:DMSO/TMAO reductase YedYZ heme-binding membrane subunit